MRWLLPPLLFLMLIAALALLWLLAPAAPIMNTGPMLAALPALAGVGLLAAARIQFRRANAEIYTFNQPRGMVTGGVFQLSRNPMYLGFTLLLLGAALFVNQWLGLLAPLSFFIISALWYIPFEEGKMRETFGAAYESYASRVRRWI